jgi:hypothetical protein
MDVTGKNDRIEAITSIQRQRRWSAAAGGILPALDFKAPQQQVRAAQPTAGAAQPPRYYRSVRQNIQARLYPSKPKT